MYKKSSKKNKRIRLIAVYTVMSISVILLATLMMMFLLGYRLDRDNGRIEQGGLLQFSSTPNGAAIEIDSNVLSSSSPTKATVLPGNHMIAMWKDKYETWSKTVSINSGTLYWLDYARLVPKNRPSETVKSYSVISHTLYSPDRKQILVQQNANDSSYDLVDIRSENTSIRSLTLPDAIKSNLASAKMSGYVLKPVVWDNGSRFVLLRAEAGQSIEWIVLDTRNPEASQDITKTLSINLQQVAFSGTSGKIFYGLSSGDLRKLDLDAGTISRAYVTQVDSFEMLNSSTLSYEAKKQEADQLYKVAGIYRDGDQSPHVIKQVAGDVSPFKIAIAQYASKDYLALLEGKSLTLYRGSFPPFDSQTNDSLEEYASLSVGDSMNRVKFSPAGDYLAALSPTRVVSYNLEHKQMYDFNVASSVGDSLKWLDDDYLYAVRDSKLFMQEFDGTNISNLMDASGTYGASLSSNQRYIYTTFVSGNSYNLNRIKMIID